jgi:DNA-binding protein HU-beta
VFIDRLRNLGGSLARPFRPEVSSRSNGDLSYPIGPCPLYTLNPEATAAIQPETMRFSHSRSLHFGRRSVLNPVTSIKGTTMPKMTKSQLIDAISESSAVSKNDVKAVVEHMAIVGYKELNESGEFVIPGFVKMSVVNKPATEARSGINPFTKEPMEFAAKPASKTVKASPLKVAKDAV